MKWKKKGLIFNPTEYIRPNWGKEYALAPSTIELENVIRVYFSCRNHRDKNNEQISNSTFIDLNKDNLNQIEYISNSPVIKIGGLGEFDEFGCVVTSAVKFEDSVRLYYIGWSRMRSIPYATAIGVLQGNKDGSIFKRIGNGGPIITSSLNSPLREHACPIVRIFENKWHMWYMSGIKWVKDKKTLRVEPQYKITYANSEDGIIWNCSDEHIIECLNEDECQTTPNVFYYKNKYHMFFSYRRMLDFRTNKERSYRIGYAYSYDLKTWIRDDSQAGIDVSDNGWDSEMICYPHIFELNNKIIMLYNGNEFGKYGFGYAELVDHE